MKAIRVPLLGTVAVVALMLAAVTAAGAAGVTTQTRDVVGQGMGGPVVSPDGATIQRSDSGVSAKLRMPTPEPDSYVYPGTDSIPGNPLQPPATGLVGFPPAVPGHPEAYSLWVFVFNDPSVCASDPCTIADFNANLGTAGAFNAGGHLVGGGNLQLSGRVTLSSTPFVGAMLTNPQGAEVHLAVAPHGALDPALLPEMINLPIGNPPYWWLAIFQAE